VDEVEPSSLDLMGASDHSRLIVDSTIHVFILFGFIRTLCLLRVRDLNASPVSYSLYIRKSR
jgi:hypothetical protein